MSIIDTIIIDETEYSLGGSGEEYKTPIYYTTTLTPATTLENTRVMSNTASSVSGYTTYLFSFADMTTAGYEALVSTFSTEVSYYGYYVQSGSSYTYTNTISVSPYCPVVNTNYTGFFVSTNKEMTFSYYYAIGVGTSEGYRHGTQKGFRSISAPYLTFKSSGSSGYIRVTGLSNDNAYIIDVGGATPNAFYQETTSTVIGEYLQLTADTKQYLVANLAKAPLQLEFRPNQQSDNLRRLCERGVWLWELTEPYEVVAARSEIPKVCLLHGGNTLDTLIFAMAQGWAGTECDVRTTSDGIAVLSHETSIGGNAIATSTYDTLVAVAPNTMTVDEMLKIIGRFNGWVDFHWQAVDDATKLKHIQKAYGYGCSNVMYYVGSRGTYIGDTITLQDFWKTGVAYCSGLSTHDTTNPNIKYDLDSHLSWVSTDLGSSVTITYTNLTDNTYASYNFIFAYFHTPCLYQ